MGAIAGFDWDNGNRKKCQKHGVSIAEIEALFSADVGIRPDPDHSYAEPRRRAVGRTETGRYVFVVFTIRERGGVRLIRPVSARYMHRKEIDHYEKQTAEAVPRIQK